MATNDSSVLQDDLRDMLRALGMSDAARPNSPHEVFRECIATAERLRNELSTTMTMRLTEENARLRSALKPFADLADRAAYTLDDVPHGLMIEAKLALRGMRIVNGLVQQGAEEK